MVADNQMRLDFIQELSKQIKEDRKATTSTDIQQYARTLLVRLQRQIVTENKLTLLQRKVKQLIEVFTKS